MYEVLKTYNSPFELEGSYMEALVNEYNDWREQGYDFISFEIERPGYGDVVIRITGKKCPNRFMS